MNNRLEELLRMKEDIEADEDTCIHCLVKDVLRRVYDIGYEDAILNVEE